MFDDSFARHAARRYRKRGLTKPAQRIVDLVVDHGIQDATVLEVGGGVGEIHLELLERGASRVTNLELSPAYDAQARSLLAEHGLTDRVDRRIVDIATAPDEIAPADVVVLHRVVCCYPDYATLLGAAADHARRLVVFSHPRRSAVTRAVEACQHGFNRVRGREFRFFVHPPEAMTEVLVAHGLRVSSGHRGFPWQIMTAVR
jgi:magnesium-protoporphyrin O-methyltransferase